ncbi:hypothetical protein ACOSQ3_020301 [Xanthoceras sorbifolium]
MLFYKIIFKYNYYYMKKKNITVRLFLWRLCNEWIPSAGTLLRRHIVGNGFFLSCSSGFESPIHACWGCPRLHSVRKSRPSLAALPADFHGSSSDFLALCKASLVTTEFEVFYIILWRAWFVCNCFEYRTAIAFPVAAVIRAVVPPRWEAPSQGWFKINSDAAIDPVNKCVSFGVVIRDSFGRVVAVLAEPYPVLVPVVVAEAMAIHRGIQLAV